MGSIVAKSIMAKNRTAALKDTGLKSSLVLSISFSVISDSFILTLISSLVLFESSRMLISSSSSRMSAIFSFLVRPVRIWSSISTRVLADWAFYWTIASFFFWSSGIS